MPKAKIFGREYGWEVSDEFSRSVRDAPEMRLEQHMFIQDCVARIAPYFAFRGGEDEPFVLREQSGREVEALSYLGELFGLSEPRRRPVDIGKVIRHLAERLPWTGRLLVDTRRLDSADERRRGVLRVSDGRGVMRIAGRFVQFIVTRDAARNLVLRVGIVPADRVASIGLRRTLWDWWRYRMLLWRLDWFRSTGPDYMVADAEAGKGMKIVHDVSAYYRNVAAFRDRTTREVGWNGRDDATKFRTEYYAVVRHLRFQRYLAEVRATLMRSLEEILKKRGFNAEISAPSLVSEGSFDEIFQGFQAGKLSVGEAAKAAGFP